MLDQTALTNPEPYLVKVNISKSTPIRSIEIIKKIEEVIHKPFKLIKSLKFKIEDTIIEQIRLTQEQQKAFKYLEEEKCLGVRGRAGTGKTLLAVNRAKQLSIQGEKVLFICYNRGLADFLSAELNQTNVDVFTYHAYAKCYLEKYYPHRALGTSDDPNYFSHIAKEFAEVIEENMDKYTSCIIDEAQDLAPVWFIALKETFYPKYKFYYFFDPLQILYSRKIELEESHFIFGSTVVPLNRNMRNTSQVSQSSLNILGASYNPQKHFSSLDGDYPVIILNESDFRSELHKVLNTLNIVEQIEKEDITIISMKGEGNSSLGLEFDDYEIISFRKFKGLDNKVIIIIDIDFKHFEDDVYERELYMAITRTKYLVYLLINDQDSLMKKSFCERLKITSLTREIINNYLKENNYE